MGIANSGLTVVFHVDAVRFPLFQVVVAARATENGREPLCERDSPTGQQVHGLRHKGGDNCIAIPGQSGPVERYIYVTFV